MKTFIQEKRPLVKKNMQELVLNHQVDNWLAFRE